MLIITPYKIKKAFLYFKHFGPKEFLNHLLDRLEPEDVPYDKWFNSHYPRPEELEKQRKSAADKEENAVLFSVIVPAYNIENYLPRCLESLLAQTHRDLEIVVVNDGSVDGTAAVIDQYAAKDSRIKAIHKENGGVTSARLYGIREAAGAPSKFLETANASATAVIGGRSTTM